MKHTLQRAERLAARIPSILALAAGILTALAHPPFGFLPGLLAYGLLMRMGDAAPTRTTAFRWGWTAGLGYFAVGCWWVAEAFMVDAKVFGWMAPFAIALLAGGLAVFWGLALLLYRAIAPKGVTRVLVFAGAIALLEWIRGFIFTGFPWNLPGESWKAGGLISQFASVVGAYGLTWITVAIAAAPALLWRAERLKTAWTAVAAAILTLVLMAGYGLDALLDETTFTLPSGYYDGKPLIRVVQPNIPQAAKYDQASFDAIVATYTTLTAKPSTLRTPDIVVWPEGAIPDSANSILADDSPTRAAITRALKPGQILLFGAYRFDGPDAEANVYNSLIAVKRTAAGLDIIGVYDKHTLVPFGEFIPLEAILTPLGFKKLVPLDSFTPGPRPRPLPLGEITVQPLICYESLFPGFTRDGWKASGVRADAIVNISNDAWFGATSGPWQHLNLASYRAIEEGLPMIRATPTGVSVMIDANGRSHEPLTLGQRGVIDTFLARAKAPTPYARMGNLGFLLMLLASALVSARVLLDRQKST